MKKSILKRVFLVIAIILALLVIFFIAMLMYASWADDYLAQAKYNYKLGKKATYIIKETQHTYSDGETVTYHIFCRPTELNCLSNPDT